MGIFDWLRPTDINKGVEAFRAEPGAVLLDVRTPQEYCEGRIPGSRNIPLQSLGQVEAIAMDKGTPLFVYCYSGARSRCAVGMLRQMGYTRVEDIGGITGYRGQLER